MQELTNLFALNNLKKFNFGLLILIVSMLGMTILPLPPFLLDLLFTFNIALSLIILMVCIYVSRPLDFSIFPTILLVTTLLRLTLNIASTRVVLLNGHIGTHAAGQVIQSFGEVVIGGSFVVGMIVFAILMIINFVVVTKGAGRISEVSARFTLDALPGKQMSIDADVNSGIITQEEAKKRRTDVMNEADFYGSMDGASKFVRGDAIAGMLILAINLIGGIFIGIFQHDMAFTTAFKTFSLLTIGDGLVSQIPSLLLSISAAIMVTRVTNEADISQQTLSQIFSDPKPLLVTAMVLFVLALIPNMPHLPFLFLAALIAFIAFKINSKAKKKGNVVANKTLETIQKSESHELDWDEVVSVDRIALEIGFGLIGLVGVNKDGILINRIKAIRKKLSHDLGFLIPTVHVKDNLTIPANHYRIYLKNVVIAESDVYVDKMLAINPGHVNHPLNGIKTKDPTFGLEAYWIAPTERELAQANGFTVVDVNTVMTTHLNHLIKTNAHHLLGYDELQQLLDKLGNSTPRLVEMLTSGAQAVPPNIVLTVLQRLLQSNIPIIDMRTIAEKMIEGWAKNKDIDSLIENVRMHLKHLIIYSICSNKNEVPVAVIDNDLAQILHKSIQQSQLAGEKIVVLEPSLTERLYTKLLEFVQHCKVESIEPIMLVTNELRALLEKVFKPGIPTIHFLSHGEIPDDRKLNIIAKIG